MSSEQDPELGTFLRLLRGLPGELALKMPVLRDIADLSGNGGRIDVAAAQPGIIRRRLDRRYARICVVYGELSKLDFKKAKPGTGLEDLVFAQTDFAVYQKISREDFNTFFDEGLDDFEDSFYKNNFTMDRSAVRKTIFHWYKPEGEYYSCVANSAGNPLLLGIMRTLHTALDFVPLIKTEETLKECEILMRLALGEDALAGLTKNFSALYFGLLRSLDNSTVIHPDGMNTALSFRMDETPPALYGTFHPSNKAHTIRLA
ncbi:hypothetical protein LQZ19_04090 [Treponema primitia]|uniref:hypothetical protein n=1 Tax=Treponema primitia TaxID=88058 RepID=UPI00397F4E1C